MKTQVMRKSESWLTVEEAIAQFEKLLTAGMDNIRAAADLYVRAIDAAPGNDEKFKQHFGSLIPFGFWDKLEDVGRRRMHWRLLWGLPGDLRIERMIKNLSYYNQVKILDQKERFPLLLESGEKMMISIHDATPNQVEQLIGGKNIRTVIQQRAWLEDNKMQRKIIKKDAPRYKIFPNGVYIERGIFTPDEVEKILAEMKNVLQR